MPYTVKTDLFAGLFLQKILIRLLHTGSDQGINILPVNLVFPGKGIFYMGGHCSEHTACRCNADLFKLTADCRLKLLLYFRYGFSYLLDVMDLPVQHGSGLMLLAPLSGHNKLISLFVAHGSHNTSGSDVKSEYKLSRILCVFH